MSSCRRRGSALSAAADAADAPDPGEAAGIALAAVVVTVTERGTVDALPGEPAWCRQSDVGAGVAGAGTYTPASAVATPDDPISSVHGVSEHSTPPTKHVVGAP